MFYDRYERRLTLEIPDEALILCIDLAYSRLPEQSYDAIMDEILSDDYGDGDVNYHTTSERFYPKKMSLDASAKILTVFASCGLPPENFPSSPEYEPAV